MQHTAVHTAGAQHTPLHAHVPVHISCISASTDSHALHHRDVVDGILWDMQYPWISLWEDVGHIPPSLSLAENGVRAYILNFAPLEYSCTQCPKDSGQHP